MTSAAVPARRRPGSALLIGLLLVAHLVPVWAVSHWPSQDGPEHAFNAAVLRDYHRPDGAVYRRFFTLNRRPVPNWATALITRGLLTVASPAVADKLIVSGYLVAFYAAAVYVVGGLSPGGSPGRSAADAAYAPLVVLPFAFGFFLFMGFYNFCYSLPVLLVVYGYCLRRANRFTAAGLLGLAGLSLALYFCHIVTFGIEAGFLGLAALGPAVTGGGTWVDRLRRFGRAAVPLVALAPAVALALLFLGRGSLGAGSQLVSPVQRFTHFVTWGDWFHKRDAAVSAGLMLAFAAATAAVVGVRRRDGGPGWRRGDLLLATAAATACLSLVTPDAMSGGAFVVFRVNLLAVLTWAVWLAVQPLPRWAGVGLRWAGGLATVAVLVASGRTLWAEDGFLREYVSAAPAIRPGASILPVSYAASLDQSDRGVPPFRRVDCMLHAVAWVAADRHAVDVTDYEATTDYFPTLFRPDVNPAGIKRWVTPTRYAAVTGFRPDYVLLWTGGVGPQTWVDREAAADLTRDYRLTYQSPGRGFVQVYELAPGGAR